jgi:hypothetical protein
MIQKPSDFFFGIVDFFAILMPGALLVFLLSDLGTSLFGDVLPPLSTDAAKWIAFGVASYVLGHVLHHLGSIVLDWAYDKVYVKRWKRKEGEERLLTKARELMAAALGKDKDMTSAFSWAGSYVRIRSDAAGRELERLGADSKFFRSLALVAMVAVGVFAAESAFGAIAVSIVLLAFSLWRFFDRRWRATQLTYEYYIMLSMQSPSGKDAKGDT